MPTNTNIKRAFLTQSLSDAFIIIEETNPSQYGISSYMSVNIYNSGSNYTRHFDLQKEGGIEQIEEYANSLASMSLELIKMIDNVKRVKKEEEERYKEAIKNM